MDSQIHKEFPQPSDSAVLAWRYLDLSRFLSLLLKKELYLTRLDALEDKYEGTLPLQIASMAFAELRPTMSSERAWTMIEKTVSFLRKFQNPQSMKELTERYFNATQEWSQERFVATFSLFWLSVVLQLTRLGRAAALAAAEAKHEDPALQARFDDSEFYRKLAESTGVLLEAQILVDLDRNYERIPPEGRGGRGFSGRGVSGNLPVQYSNRRTQIHEKTKTKPLSGVQGTSGPGGNPG